jgi:hypothetical protein
LVSIDNWRDAIKLNASEQIISFWEGHLQPPRVLSHGMLVLTNKRLLWVAKEKLLDECCHVLIDVALSNLRRMDIEGILNKRLYIGWNSDGITPCLGNTFCLKGHNFRYKSRQEYDIVIETIEQYQKLCGRL